MNQYEQMSNNDLARLAGLALGYVECEFVIIAILKQQRGISAMAHDLDCWVRYRKEGGGMNPWKPCEDANQAIEVARWIENQFRLWLIIRTIDGGNYEVELLNDRFECDSAGQIALYDDPSFARALTICSLLALDAMKGSSQTGTEIETK